MKKRLVRGLAAMIMSASLLASCATEPAETTTATEAPVETTTTTAEAVMEE